jgi:putative DNA primase/helicase
VVAEGVEDGLAAAELTGLPAWAALSASNLRDLVVPDRFRAVLILADRDANGVGQAAALALAARLRAEGREVAARAPEALKDANDVLRSLRPGG